jgi:hypothetical protein
MAVAVLTRIVRTISDSPVNSAEWYAELTLKEAAVELLGKHGVSNVIREVLRESTNGQIASIAARALAEDRSAITTEILLERLAFFLENSGIGDNTWKAIENIISSLAGRDVPQVVQRLRSLVGKLTEERTHDISAYIVNSAAVTALAQTRPDNSLRDLLLAILERQDEGPVTRAAAQGLIAMATQDTLSEDVVAWVAACRKDPHLPNNAFYIVDICEDFAWATSIIPPFARKIALEQLASVWKAFDPEC